MPQYNKISGISLFRSSEITQNDCNPSFSFSFYQAEGQCIPPGKQL